MPKIHLVAAHDRTTIAFSRSSDQARTLFICAWIAPARGMKRANGRWNWAFFLSCRLDHFNLTLRISIMFEPS
jgi:hypothetical protein